MGVTINIQQLTTRTFGGDGGEPFTGRGIKTLQLRSGSRVDAILINGKKFGGDGGDLGEKITLASDEFITRIEIRSGSRVDRLEITTDKGQQIEGGGQGGKPSTLKGTIVALGGRSGSGLDRIDVLGVFN